MLLGERYNLFETGLNLTVTSEDAFYPKSRIYGRRPIQPFRFASAGVGGDSITIDGNRLRNGDLNSWTAGAPVDWVETGTVDETTTAGEFRSGSAAKIAALSRITQEFTARAGERIVINGWRRISATATFEARLINVQTGRRWNGTTWADADNTFLSDSSNTTYTEYAATTATVEAFAAAERDTYTLRLDIRNAGIGGNAFADDWAIWAEVDFAAIFGHNIDATVPAQLRSSTDNFSASDVLQATMTKAQPSFYTTITTSAHRYWRLRFFGTNHEAIRIGEAVIGQYRTMTRKMSDAGIDMQYVENDNAAESETGELLVVSRADHERRIIGLEFDFTSHAEFEEGRDEVFRRSRGRAHPLIVVPDSSRPDVIFGHIENRWKARRVLDTLYRENVLYITEAPFPIVTS